MSHIHTQPHQHDVTASAWIVRLDGEKPRVMLHRHLKLGSIMQFGGHVELNEHPWEAVTREIREEAGYSLDQLQVLQPEDTMTHLSGVILLPQPLCIFNTTYGSVLDHFHDDISWGFVASEQPRHAPGEDESDTVVLLDRSQVLAKKDDELWDDVADIALFILDVALPKWRRSPALPFTRQ